MGQFIEDNGIRIPLDLYRKFGVTTLFYQEFLLFEEAREFAKRLGLTNRKKWFKYAKTKRKPDNIPFNPSTYYKDKGWISWGDFLGTGNLSNISKNKVFLFFEKAREFVINLKLKTQKEWYEYCRSGERPAYIPAHPHMTYKGKGWINWKDFLGTNK